MGDVGGLSRSFHPGRKYLTGSMRTGVRGGWIEGYVSDEA